MKRLSFVLFAAVFAVAASSNAQTRPFSQNQDGRTQASGSGATDDFVNQNSTIRRPEGKATPAAAKADGPKKPLQASLSADEKGKSSASNFAANTPAIYLQWKDESATKGEKIRVVWVGEDAAGIPKNKKLTENAQTLPGPGAFGAFSLPAPGGKFPVGKYRADLYEGAKLAKSLKFSVK